MLQLNKISQMKELILKIKDADKAYFVLDNPIMTDKEYDELVDFAIEIGVENGFIQEGETAKESFIPAFNEEGWKTC